MWKRGAAYCLPDTRIVPVNTCSKIAPSARIVAIQTCRPRKLGFFHAMRPMMPASALATIAT
jgi:hypothetical protein